MTLTSQLTKTTECLLSTVQCVRPGRAVRPDVGRSCVGRRGLQRDVSSFHDVELVVVELIFGRQPLCARQRQQRHRQRVAHVRLTRAQRCLAHNLRLVSLQHDAMICYIATAASARPHPSVSFPQRTAWSAAAATVFFCSSIE